MNRSRLLTLLTAGLLGLLAGCSEETVQARGFAMPPGDAELGRQTFIRLQCQQCHTVAGVELPADQTMRDGPTLVRLGGTVTSIKTQGDLVTSIINPSHRIVGWRDDVTNPDGESIMTVYNNVMTVTELINLAEFLQAHYEFTPPVYPVP
jgi:hypothetical protein